ncbi:MAG: hypothetical protein ACO2PO_16055 [Candidatus Calescibacterium sp.]
MKRQTINAEIFIKSYSTWAIEKKFVVGEEDQDKNKEKSDKNKEKSQSKKAKAEVVITRYEESPQFFDQHGNPKTYKIKVDVEYRIICEDEKDFSGKFSAHEIFLSSNPRDYTLSVSKSKLTIERKIIHKVISQIQKMCFR